MYVHTDELKRAKAGTRSRVNPEGLIDQIRVLWYFIFMKESYNYNTLGVERQPRVAFDGEAVRTETLDMRRKAAQVANAAAGVELFEVVIPEDQTFSGTPVGEGYTRILLTGSYVHTAGGDAEAYWRVLDVLKAEQAAQEVNP
jgi:hypothetical protein